MAVSQHNSASIVDVVTKATNEIDHDIFSEVRRANKPKYARKLKARDDISDKKWEETVDETERLYRLCAVFEGTPSKWNYTANEMDDIQNCWRIIIATALKQDKDFQTLVMEDNDVPDVIDWNRVSVEPAWLIGLYLPGFFHLGFRNIQSKVLRPVCSLAIKDAKQAIQDLILKQIAKLKEEEEKAERFVNTVENKILPSNTLMQRSWRISCH